MPAKAGTELDARRNMKILIADTLDPSAKLALEDIGHEVQEIHSVNSDDLDQHIQGIEVLSLIHI